MAWNEPGKRDPWQGKPQPPDFEALFKRLREGFNRLFRGGGGVGGGGPGGIALIVLALVIGWLALDSWTVIDARQIGVVLRFGQFNRVMTSGLNLKWPVPVERVIRVDATNVRSVSDEVRMLTRDENIVLIDFNVQYQVTDAKKYLFDANQPDETLKQAAESAVRQVIGRSAMDTILSGHGSEVVGETKKLLQQTLDEYGVGLLVTEINFQKILPPPEVKEAFDDANNAGNNQQQFVNEAQGYAAKVVPLARGEAARIRAAAEGYKAAQIATATGEAERFRLIDVQYKAAPEVTRKRLYLETMQEVMADSLKVIDSGSGKNLIYLPLDKLKSELDAAASGAAAATTSEDAQKKSKEGSP
ncbi:MAG: FtsH protease activity modulator HflK [Proteobacteria bacterium]|nr:FtsH protease activity modulator HflK [Pseudomonadota bacterium]